MTVLSGRRPGADGRRGRAGRRRSRRRRRADGKDGGSRQPLPYLCVFTADFTAFPCCFCLVFSLPFLVFPLAYFPATVPFCSLQVDEHFKELHDEYVGKMAQLVHGDADMGTEDVATTAVRKAVALHRAGTASTASKAVPFVAVDRSALLREEHRGLADDGIDDEGEDEAADEGDQRDAVRRLAALPARGLGLRPGETARKGSFLAPNTVPRFL